MATDEIIRRSLSLPAWADGTTKDFRQALPAYLQVSNPLDTSGVMADDADILRSVLRAASGDKQTDLTLVCLGGSRAREHAVVDGLAALTPEIAKPTLVVWAGGSPEVYRRMRQAGIIAFDGVEDAIAAVSLARAQAPADAATDPASQPCGLPPREAARATALAMIEAACAAGRTMLDEVESKTILRAYGVPCVAEVTVGPDGDAGQAAAGLSYPLVAKLRSAEVPHKSDVGGVMTGIADAGKARVAVADLLALGGRLGLRHADVVLQEQVDIGVELILGASADPPSGQSSPSASVALRLRVARDVQVMLPSLTRPDACRALDRLRSQHLLGGFRGAAPVPRQQVADTVRSLRANGQ